MLQRLAHNEDHLNKCHGSGVDTFPAICREYAAKVLT